MNMEYIRMIFAALSLLVSGGFLKWLLDHYFMSKKETIEIKDAQNKYNDEASLKLMDKMQEFIKLYQDQIIQLNVQISELKKSNEECDKQYKELNTKYMILQNDFNKLSIPKA